MKFKDGKVVSLEDVEHMKKFISRKDSKKYRDAIERIPFSYDTIRGRRINRQSFLYSGDPPVDFMEDIIVLIEEIFETRVNGVKCEHFKDGNDFTPKGRFGDDSRHVFILTFGETRHMELLTSGNKKIRETLKDRSLLYYRAYDYRSEDEKNSIKAYTVPKSLDTKNSTYCVILFTEAPYCRRSEKKVVITFPNNDHIEMYFDYNQAGEGMVELNQLQNLLQPVIS